MERRRAKMMSFQDDLESAAKIFARLNSFRKLNGFKEVEWNEILCELALSRSHQLVRSRGIVQSLQIGGAKFNLGVTFLDLAAYSPLEEKDGKQIPLHRTLERTWKSIPKFSNALLDPLVRFGAISVYKSNKSACVTIFFTILFPTRFSPRQIKKGEEKKRSPKKKKKQSKVKTGVEEGVDIVTSDTDSESADECAVSLEADDMTPLKPEIHQLPLLSLPSDCCESVSIDMTSIEEEVMKSIAEDSSDGSVYLKDDTICEHDGARDEDSVNWMA